MPNPWPRYAIARERNHAHQYSDYPTHARRLADAGASLLEAIADPAMDRSLSIVELESAAATPPVTGLRARFEPSQPQPPPHPLLLPQNCLRTCSLESSSISKPLMPLWQVAWP